MLKIPFTFGGGGEELKGLALIPSSSYSRRYVWPVLKTTSLVFISSFRFPGEMPRTRNVPSREAVECRRRRPPGLDDAPGRPGQRVQVLGGQTRERRREFFRSRRPDGGRARGRPDSRAGFAAQKTACAGGAPGAVQAPSGETASRGPCDDDYHREDFDFYYDYYDDDGKTENYRER